MARFKMETGTAEFSQDEGLQIMYALLHECERDWDHWVRYGLIAWNCETRIAQNLAVGFGRAVGEEQVAIRELKRIAEKLAEDIFKKETAQIETAREKDTMDEPETCQGCNLPFLSRSSLRSHDCKTERQKRDSLVRSRVSKNGR